MEGLRVGAEEVYAYNIARLKKYRDDYYKIVLYRTIRRAGYEAEEEETGYEKVKKNTAGNGGKMEASISRTRSTIFELALCND